MKSLLPSGNVFINCCPTGMVLTKKHNPFLPASIDEIICESRALIDLGVGMIHIHARDEDGVPTWRKEVYARIIAGIREKNPDVVLCVSTSGRLWSDFERRSEVLELDGDLKPDMASLTLGSLNFMNSATVNEPQMIMDLARKMSDKGIKPELEIFDTGMLNTLLVMQRKGILAPPYYINFIFGNIYSMQFNPHLFTYLMDNCPEQAVVALAGVGSWHVASTEFAVSVGLGVRVGLEDCHFTDTEKKGPATNTGLVERILQKIRSSGQGILSGKELRRILRPSQDAS